MFHFPDVQKIVKQKLRIKEEEFRVFPYYESLGTAVYGREKPSPKLPSAVSEHVDQGVWTYITKNQPVADTIHSHMAKHFCRVNLKEQNVTLNPVPSLLQEKDPKVIKQWREVAKSEFAQQLSNFKSLNLPLVPESWDDAEKGIAQKLGTENVVVVPNKARGYLVVAGHAPDVDRLQPSLFQVVHKISEMREREKSCITKKVKLSQGVYHLICQGGFKDNLLGIYPHLIMTYQSDSPNLIVTGLAEEIMELQKVLCDQVMDCKRQNFDADKFVLDLLKNNKQEELTKALLNANGLKAAFEITDNGVQLVARNDRDLKDAMDHLKTLLMSEYVEVTDKTVLNMPEWNQLVSRLEQADVVPFKKIRVDTSDKKVVVSGLKDCVAKAASELGQFLTRNAEVEQKVLVKSGAVIEYIQKSGMPWLDKVNDKVVVWCQKDAICLSGRCNHVSECKTLVEDQVAAVVLELFKVSKPGAMKIYESQEDAHGSLILNSTGCVVQLVKEVTADQNGAPVRGPDKAVSKPLYQNQTSDGVEIVVCKADLCQYPVHAVICGTTEGLKNTSGFAKALVSAAGPQLQLECDQWISSKGRPNSGACIILSGGGQLCCKKVIFTVVPKLDPANIKTLTKMKVAIAHSLQLAESQGFTSVALPVIGKNQGVSTDLCTATIAKAVKRHCEDMLDDSVLKTIHFVDIDDVAIKSMAAAIRVEFDNDSTATSPQVPVVKGPELAHANQSMGNPKCLGQEQTKEGLNIVLMKENLENAKVIA